MRRTLGTYEKADAVTRNRWWPSAGARSASMAAASSVITTTRPEVAELSEAVDQYKLKHHRRFITFEELYGVITELGYHK